MRLALALVSLALMAARQVQAAPPDQADEAPDLVWLQNHTEVTLWSDDSASGQAVATIPRFLGFFQAKIPFTTERGRIFVYYPGDTTGVPGGYVWVEARA